MIASAADTSPGDELPSSGNRGDQSYDKMMKSLMHASNEKSLLLQEIQSLKSQLKETKKDVARLEAGTSASAGKTSSAGSTTDSGSTSVSSRPGAGANYRTDDGDDVVVMRTKEVMSTNKLLETNLRTGIMATLWAIKAQLTKRLCGAFSRWRLNARLLSTAAEAEIKLLAVLRESEAAVRNARAAGSGVGGDSASKVWMGTAMKLLALQRKKDSLSVSASKDLQAEAAAAAAAAAATAAAADARPRVIPRRSNVLLKPVAVMASSATDAHADGPSHAGTQLRVQTFGLLEDDGEPFAAHSDEEDEAGREHGQGRGRGHNSEEERSRGRARSRGGAGTGYGGASDGASVASGSSSKRGRAVAAAATGVTVQDIQRHYREHYERQAAARKAYTLKGLRDRSKSPSNTATTTALLNLQQAGRSRGSSAPRSRVADAAVSSTGSKYSRDYSAIRQATGPEKNFWGSDYTDEATREAGNTFKNSPRSSPANSPRGSGSGSGRGSPSGNRSDSKLRARASSAPPSTDQRSSSSSSSSSFTKFTSVADWAASVLNVNNSEANNAFDTGYGNGNGNGVPSGRAWAMARKAAAAASSSSSSFNRRAVPIPSYAALTSSAAQHRAQRTQLQHVHDQHAHEYSTENAHFLSGVRPRSDVSYNMPPATLQLLQQQQQQDNPHRTQPQLRSRSRSRSPLSQGSERGRRTSDGGTARRQNAALNRQTEVQRGNWQTNHLDQLANSPSRPKHSMLRDGGALDLLTVATALAGAGAGVNTAAQPPRQSQGQRVGVGVGVGVGEDYRAQDSAATAGHHHAKITQFSSGLSHGHGHFMAPTASSMHHQATTVLRKKVHEQHDFEYSPEHAHNMGHVKPLKSHAGRDIDHYFENDDRMQLDTYQQFRGELLRDAQTTGGLTAALTEQEVADAEREIEQMLAVIGADSGSDRLNFGEGGGSSITTAELKAVSTPNSKDEAEEAVAAAAAALHVQESGKHAVEILAHGLEMKRHAKKVVAERMEALAAAGHNRQYSSESLRAQTVALESELHIALNGGGSATNGASV